jgi:predicted nucleic acid-binding Zn ribbon protein
MTNDILYQCKAASILNGNTIASSSFVPQVPNSSMTFKEASDLNKSNLEGLFNETLQRYQCAYAYYLKNQVAPQGEETISDLNNKLKILSSELKTSLNLDMNEINSTNSSIKRIDNKINKNSSTVSLQNNILKKKYQDLVSETQMNIYGLERNRNKSHTIVIYVIILIILVILFFSLFTKLTQK